MNIKFNDNIKGASKILFDIKNILLDQVNSRSNYNLKLHLFLQVEPYKNYNIDINLKFISEEKSNTETYDHCQQKELKFVSECNNFISSVINSKQIISQDNFYLSFVIPTADYITYLAEIKITRISKKDIVIPEIDVNDNDEIEKIKNVIKQSGSEGISHSQLIRKTQFLNKVDRNIILNGMIDFKEIIKENVKTKARPQIIYRWIGNE